MFSERYGFKEKEILQDKDVSGKLQVDIWNTLVKYFFNQVVYKYTADPYSGSELKNCEKKEYIFNLYENFFYEPINDLRDKPLYRIKNTINNYYNKLEWYEIYDFVEFIGNILNNEEFEQEINFKLQRHNSAYRMVNNEIIPITNEAELIEIKQAANSKFEIVNEHINKAIKLFSDKNSPDYENTIKESITAVETMCSIIVGNKTTLGDALRLLESKGITIHPALKSSFNTLYGYTSDGNGIRHAGNLDAPNSTFAEAKFMLVSCSAFVNYLIENSKSII